MISARCSPIVEGAGGVASDWQGAPLDLASDGRVLVAGDRRAHERGAGVVRRMRPRLDGEGDDAQSVGFARRPCCCRWPRSPPRAAAAAAMGCRCSAN